MILSDFWADAQYVNLFRHLFVMEDGPSLMITPALFRRWHQGTKPVAVHSLPTHFGDLDLNIQPQADGNRIDYSIRITPKGDQEEMLKQFKLMGMKSPEVGGSK